MVLVVKNLSANAGDARDADSTPGLIRSPGVGNVNPLQYSCMGNSMDRGAWWAPPWGHKESDMTEHTHHTHTQRMHGWKVEKTRFNTSHLSAASCFSTGIILAWMLCCGLFFLFVFFFKGHKPPSSTWRGMKKANAEMTRLFKHLRNILERIADDGSLIFLVRQQGGQGGSWGARHPGDGQ